MNYRRKCYLDSVSHGVLTDRQLSPHNGSVGRNNTTIRRRIANSSGGGLETWADGNERGASALEVTRGMLDDKVRSIDDGSE